MENQPLAITGKYHLLIDLLAGSCGKGAISPRLSEIFGLRHVACHNLPNAGHTAVSGDSKFVSKAIPTPMIRKLWSGTQMVGYISPGSGFKPMQLVTEWAQCGRPDLFIHDRAIMITPEHAQREREGAQSTKHLASTMQGSATSQSDKMLRLPDVRLAKYLPELIEEFRCDREPDAFPTERVIEDFLDHITICDGPMFRAMTRNAIETEGMLHEGSQGYALSINHGISYPQCTSRDCDTMQAMSYMAVPPQKAGNVWGVIRAGHYIRVGNVVEGGVKHGDSGGGYPDSKEITWETLGLRAGMPAAMIAQLFQKELTTVTGRLRKVFTQSDEGIADAIETCGITGLIVNFQQYINWADHQKTRFEDLSPESRQYIDDLEDNHGVPVVMIGTGADHREFIWRG